MSRSAPIGRCSAGIINFVLQKSFKIGVTFHSRVFNTDYFRFAVYIHFIQGVQAQTVANFLLAFEAGLTVIPVINKVCSLVQLYTLFYCTTTQ